MNELMNARMKERTNGGRKKRRQERTNACMHECMSVFPKPAPFCLQTYLKVAEPHNLALFAPCSSQSPGLASCFPGTHHEVAGSPIQPLGRSFGLGVETIFDLER